MWQVEKKYIFRPADEFEPVVPDGSAVRDRWVQLKLLGERNPNFFFVFWELIETQTSNNGEFSFVKNKRKLCEVAFNVNGEMILHHASLMEGEVSGATEARLLTTIWNHFFSSETIEADGLGSNLINIEDGGNPVKVCFPQYWVWLRKAVSNSLI